VLDLTLPDLPGIEVARRLRSAPATSRIPLIVLTGNHDEACEAESLRAGVDDYVGKPFDEDVLRARMKERAAARAGPGPSLTLSAGGPPPRWPAAAPGT
jgi:DNA-binding response OmpR family regulator